MREFIKSPLYRICIVKNRDFKK